MPGITSVEVKSRGAYGSLRDVTINFQCWDIRQLEDLELLYMRPGYTVLVEWGWMPYLNPNGSLGNSVDFIDDVLNAKNSNPSRNSILKKIFTKTTENSNYDAHYGYVKQYGWSSREDGGYDCTVTIISVGEIIESLKINYSPLNYSSQVYGGVLVKNIGTKKVKLDRKKLRQNYTRNILAGLFYELWEIGREVDNESSESFTDTVHTSSTYDIFHKNININGGTAEATSDGSVGESDEQVYITLATLFELLNNYVLPKSNNGEKIVKCSVLDREYLGTLSPKPDTGEGGYLLCLAHPLQISMDPTICAIKSNLWINGFKINSNTVVTGTEGNNVVRFSNTNFVPLFNKLGLLLSTSNIDSEQFLTDIAAVTGQQSNELRELQRQYLIILDAATKGKGVPPELSGLQNSFFNYVKEKKPSSFYNLMTNVTGTASIKDKVLGETNSNVLQIDPSESANKELEKAKAEVEKAQKPGETNNIAYLKNLKRPYFYQDDYNTELGIIGNIYVNVNFLYRLAIGGDLESLDSKEKQDINLYDFLKSVASEISNSTGNVNNFEVYIDPQDDIVRIIDVNYVDAKKNRDEIYQKLYEVQLHNLKSTTRSYKLESQIFPDQSSTVAIGAQVGGGAMATDNNTWLDFNKNIKDRVIEKKIDALANNNEDPITSLASQLENLKQSLSSIYDFFADLEDWGFLADSDYDADKAGAYKNSLRDLILFFKNLTKSDIKNRSIIPTKLSVTLDGIGGLVIGHMFKIPEDLIPRGYKGGLIGSKLGYVTTGIGHSIGGGDWTTTIDAQTIILDNPSGGSFNFSDMIIGNTSGSSGSPPTTTSPVKVTAVQAPIVKKYGEVGDKSKIVTLNLPYTLYYGTTPVNKVQVHELAKDSLYNILKDILTTFGPAKIKELKLDQYSGLYNIRNNTRGTAASVHSWAIAIDFYAAGNSFAAGNTAVFARPEYKPFIDIWYKHGWKSFGRELGYDWMHFQVKDAPF